MTLSRVKVICISTVKFGHMYTHTIPGVQQYFERELNLEEEINQAFNRASVIENIDFKAQHS